jgi:hypothetical protein
VAPQKLIRDPQFEKRCLKAYISQRISALRQLSFFIFIYVFVKTTNILETILPTGDSE